MISELTPRPHATSQNVLFLCSPKSPARPLITSVLETCQIGINTEHLNKSVKSFLQVIKIIFIAKDFSVLRQQTKIISLDQLNKKYKF